jgi:pimeloyl-ACP methyl ester carboxylesterase
VDKNRRLGKSCLKKTGDILNYVDTISAVKDVEAVRKALGPNEKLNWLGISYGSQIGAQYAQLFPDNIRAMALDGIVQHSQSASSNILIEGTAVDAAFRSFFKWANTNDESPLKGQDVESLWYNLLKTAADKPIPAPRCTQDPENGGPLCRENVTAEEIRRFPQGYLNRGFVVYIANAIASAIEGDASDMSFGISTDLQPGNFAGLTIGCLDWPSTASSFEEFREKMRIGERFAPLTKGASQSYELQASCLGWPVKATNPPAKLNVRTKAPILLVNSIGDPSTSYSWAVGMLEEIQNSVLLTRNGDGHTSWDRNGATTKAMVDFLISAKLPAPTLLDS